MEKFRNSKWYIVILLIVMGMSLAFFITDLRAEDVPVPKHIGRVNDYASALSLDQKTKLEAQLKELESFPNKPQVQVLLVNTTGDDGIDAFKNKVFNEWKLGNAETNNGLLTVIAVKDRKMGTEVGYGNEPYFTDGRMAKIRVEIMTPYLKKGEWYNALSAETAEFKKIFAANPQEQIATPVDTQKAVNSATPHKSGHGGLLLFILALIVIGVIVWFIRRQRRSEPPIGYGSSRGSSRYTPDYDTDTYVSPPSYGTRRYETPSTPTYRDHSTRDSAIGGFAGGVAGGFVGSELSKRRNRDDTPSRSSSTYDSGGTSGSTSWGGSSSDSGSSSSSSSSDSSSSSSGDGGSSGGGGDSGGW